MQNHLIVFLLLKKSFKFYAKYKFAFFEKIRKCLENIKFLSLKIQENAGNCYIVRYIVTWGVASYLLSF